MTTTLIDILILFIAFFWQTYMQTLIVTLLFNIECKQNQHIIYALIFSIYCVFIKLFLPINLSALNLIFSIALNVVLFKTIYRRKLVEGVLYHFIQLIISIPTESIAGVIVFKIFKFETNVENVIGTIPVLLMINIWFTVIAIIIYKIKKYINSIRKTNIQTMENDKKSKLNNATNNTEKAEDNKETQIHDKAKENSDIKNDNKDEKEAPLKSSLYINIILVACIISPNIMFYTSNKYNYPLYLLIFNIVANIVLVALSIYDTYKCVQLEKKKEALRISELHNKSLTELLDGIRTFKHDHANMIHAISGYLTFNDIDGLKKYFSVLEHDTKKNAQLESISPSKISEPSVYTLIATKYDEASKRDIFFRVETMYDYKELAMPIYDFTKILGVLIDNAIEAAEECETKEINISFRRIETEQLQIFTIENTYKNKEIDTERIFEKDFSTKNRNSGIGLWEVRNLVDRNVNVNLVTSKDNKYFTQRLFISEILLDD